LKGYNDLATSNPELAKEWHPTKNGKLMPNMIIAGSEKKIWWLGNCGHEWKSIVYHRNKGIGCPVCAKELRTSFPEQVIFYYMKKVFETTVNSYKIDKNIEIDVFIKALRLGIEYDGEHWHKNPKRDKEKNLLCKNKNIELIRVREKNCPELDDDTYCIFLEDNSIIELEKAVAMIFAYITKYIIKINYFFKIDITRDTQDINELFILSKKDNSLLVANPELAQDWHPSKNGKLTPEMLQTGSNKKVWWLGKCGHEWQAKVCNRVNGRNCPICAGKVILKGHNDLAFTNPKLAKEWHPIKNYQLTPEKVTAGSDKKVWWLGNCGHEWQASIGHRSRGRGCPICSGKQVLEGYNDLATVNSELAKEWHPTKNENLTPNNVVANSNKKVWWQCKKGHEWEAIIANRSKGRGCHLCHKLKLKSKKMGKG